LVTEAWFIVSQTELAQGDYRQEQSIQRLLNGDAAQNTTPKHTPN
jgi:hypothetical protein